MKATLTGCRDGLRFIERVTVPPTDDLSGQVIAPGWHEEHVQKCIDGEWTTTVTLVDECREGSCNPDPCLGVQKLPARRRASRLRIPRQGTGE